MADTKIDDIIKEMEEDKELHNYFKKDGPLTNVLLNDLGVIIEQYGKGIVNVRLKDKAKDNESHEAFQKLKKYIDKIDKLNYPRSVKGYILKKLKAVATVKL